MASQAGLDTYVVDAVTGIAALKLYAHEES